MSVKNTKHSMKKKHHSVCKETATISSHSRFQKSRALEVKGIDGSVPRFGNIKSLTSYLQNLLERKGKIVFIERTMKYYQEVQGAYFKIGFTLFTDKKYFNKFYKKTSLQTDIDKVANILTKDQTSRRAIINFWNSLCYMQEMPPCFLSSQFMFRDGMLKIFVYQRSMDIGCMSQDISFFSILSQKILKKMGIDKMKVQMDWFVGSFHKECVAKRPKAKYNE